ncbi:MAG: hypothetical protein HLUCCX14_10125 [Marinobacter excellens HL-55]|uniref:Calcineurin-like phosphoesterase domain-containing protein n=1 Tax=Marinobacter excellens HL-55 TaxID=1305731 RepID=A0A0P7ZGK5_9GAMM|nr:MAG: hypothetical protein HLUCCX14_10125 [Marinobacter excellens HL-55]
MNKIFKPFVVGGLVGLLTACGGGGGESAENEGQPNDSAGGSGMENEGSPRSVASTQFIAMGDSGSGSAGQFAVGQSMADVCRIKGEVAGSCEFVLGFGDNIYEDGATSVADAQFIDKFEKPFEPMGNTPFYMVLGNHDNTGYVGGDGANNSRGDIQVDYHYEGNSPRWNMPDRYYSVDSTKIPTLNTPLTRDGKPLVKIVSLDSNPLASLVADADSRFTWQNYGMQQLFWAQDELISSNALFNISIAHHPYLSNGFHGNAGNYDFIPSFILPVISGQRWKDFLEEAVCDYTDFIMTGHDHDLQLLDEVESCGRTRFVVSGAAGKLRSLTDPERNSAMFQQGDTYGFFWVQAMEGDPSTGAPAQMCFEAYTVDPDIDGFGVLDTNGDLTPAHVQCLEKVPPANIARGRDFTGTPLSIPVALTTGEGFDPNFVGPILAFRQQLTGGLNQLNSLNPNEETQQAVGQLINGIDTLLMSIDSVSAALTEQLPAEDLAQATLSVQAAAERLNAIDTSTLPAPFDRLEDAFDAFAIGFGGSGGESSGEGLSEDIAFIVGPVVQLVINLDNILDAVDRQAKPVPVLRGVTSILATTLRGVGGTLEQVTLLDSSNATDGLVGAVNSALNSIVLEVLLLEQAPDNIGENAVILPNLLSDGLATVTREVTEQLDRNVLDPADSLLGGLLGPITGSIRDLISRLF